MADPAFPMGWGANLYISGKVFTKNFMTMKQKLVLRGERLCLEPPKIHQCLLPKLSVQNLCLTVISQFNNEHLLSSLEIDAHNVIKAN